MGLLTLTSAQKSILLFQQIHPHSSLFNIGGYALIKGELNHTVFFDSLKSLIKKHNVLQLRIISNKDQFFQYIDPEQNCEIEYIDFSHQSSPEERCLEWLNSNFQKAIDLDGRLYQSALLKHSDNRYYWFLKFHHVIADGFSLSLMFNDLCAEYSERIKNNLPVGILHSYFPEYITGEQEYRNSELYIKDREFWLEMIKRGSGPLMLKESNENNSLFSKRKELLLKRSDFQKIESFCKRHNITVFHYFISALYIFLSGIFLSRDFIVGIPVLNRSGKKAKKYVGPYFNVFPLHLNYNNALTIEELIKLVKGDLTSCIKHMRFPILDAIQAINHKGNLYNTTFSYQKIFYNSQLGESPADIVYMKGVEQMDDLDIHILDFNDEWDLKIIFDHKTVFLSDEEAELLLLKFKKLLLLLIDNQSRQIFEIDVLHEDGEQISELGNFSF